MINEYIEKNYTSLLNMFKAITKNHQSTEDLLNDCILNFLEKGNDYTTKVLNDGKVNNYLVRMAYIQFNSKTSPFYTQYKKQSIYSVPVEDMEIELEDTIEIKEDTKKLAEDVKLYIGKLPVYNRIIAEQNIVNGTSEREMSRMYNINRVHIHKDLNTIKSNIRNQFSRKDYGSY